MIIANDSEKNNALIRFYFNVNPSILNDSQWCKAVAQIDFVLDYNGTRTKVNE